MGNTTACLRNCKYGGLSGWGWRTVYGKVEASARERKTSNRNMDLGEFICVCNLPNSDVAQKILDISNMYCPKIILQE